MSTQPIYAIKDKAPEFPCWLWQSNVSRWIRHESEDSFGPLASVLCTHWSPDAPTAPTARPQAEVPETPRFRLWRHMLDEHKLTLLESELDEIIRLAAPTSRPQAEVPEWADRNSLVRLLEDVIYFRNKRVTGEEQSDRPLHQFEREEADEITTVVMAWLARHAPAAAAPSSDGPSDGASLIAAERGRQIVKEGWTADHDDYEHAAATLTEAAMCYAEAAAHQLNVGKRAEVNDTPDSWPWDSKWWKPSTDPIRNLVKAGALIAAEIDRSNRAAMQSARQGDQP